MVLTANKNKSQDTADSAFFNSHYGDDTVAQWISPPSLDIYNEGSTDQISQIGTGADTGLNESAMMTPVHFKSTFFVKVSCQKFTLSTIS